MIRFPVVVTMSIFQETPLAFIGIAPPPLERKLPASRVSCIAWNGALETSTFSFLLPGPQFSIEIPVLTSSTWPSSSAKMLDTRL